MDEWLSDNIGGKARRHHVGDEAFAQKAQARLGALLDKAKILFLASHSEELVRRNCNWVMRLERGKMVSLDPLGVPA